MRVTKLILSALFFPLLIQGQEIKDLVTYEMRNIEKLIGSTTYVVLDQHKESTYSKAITEAVEKYWTITPFEIIDQATYVEYQKDKTKSFLTRMHIVGSDQLITLNLYMGGQRSMERRGIILASIPIKYYSETDESMVYKLPTYVQNLQWQIRMIKDNGITGPASYEAYFEKQKAKLHSKTLYVLNNQLNSTVDSYKRVQKFYRHDVTMVDPEQVSRAIAERDSTIAYVSIVAPVKNWKGEDGYYTIFSAHNGESIQSYVRPVSNRAPYGVTGYDLNQWSKD